VVVVALVLVRRRGGKEGEEEGFDTSFE